MDPTLIPIVIGAVLFLGVVILSATSTATKSVVKLATLIGTLVYVVWALDAPTAQGTGGYVIWTPLAAVAIYVIAWIAALAGSLFRGS